MEAVEAINVLVSWAQKHRDRWPADTVRDRALRATLARSTKTVSGAGVLIDGFYGPQALSLSRTLFEDMVVAHWMTYCQTESWVERRLRNQYDYQRLLWHEVMAKHQGSAYQGLDPVERRRIGRQRRRLEALFGKGGEISWWARDIEPVKNRQPGQRHYKICEQRSLSDLIDALEESPHLVERWGPGRDAKGESTDQGMLRWAYDIPQRLNNQWMIHHGAHALALVTGEVGGKLAFIDEPDDKWLAQAGTFIYWTFLHLMTLMVDHGAPDLADDMQRICKRPFFLAFREVTDDDLKWAKQNRNKPCPCGSGLKAKFCHGK